MLEGRDDAELCTIRQHGQRERTVDRLTDDDSLDDFASFGCTNAASIVRKAEREGFDLGFCSVGIETVDVGAIYGRDRSARLSV